MILGFAREDRYKDVLVMFQGLENLMSANARDGIIVQPRSQTGYRNCYHETLKGCEVRCNRFPAAILDHTIYMCTMSRLLTVYQVYFEGSMAFVVVSRHLCAGFEFDDVSGWNLAMHSA